jgi:hypothetical protein
MFSYLFVLPLEGEGEGEGEALQVLCNFGVARLEQRINTTEIHHRNMLLKYTTEIYYQNISYIIYINHFLFE